MDVLAKAYPTIPLSGHSELVRRYLYLLGEETFKLNQTILQTHLDGHSLYILKLLSAR